MLPLVALPVLAPVSFDFIPLITKLLFFSSTSNSSSSKRPAYEIARRRAHFYRIDVSDRRFLLVGLPLQLKNETPEGWCLVNATASGSITSSALLIALNSSSSSVIDEGATL